MSKCPLTLTMCLAIFSVVSFADNPPPSSPTAPTNTTALPANPTKPLPAPAPVSQTAPANQAAVVNCHYRIPAETTKIEQALILIWAQSAVIQSFNFNAATIDNELTELKSCFTDQGWSGFNDALQKSGNVAAIKAQNLSVSSTLDGTPQIQAIKDNQWKVTLPLQVVYQNEKEKLTQQLTVDLLIGRKITGDLGIMQMIAAPRPDIMKPQTPPPAEKANSSSTDQPSAPSSPANTPPQ